MQDQPKPGESLVRFNLGSPPWRWLPLQCHDLEQIGWWDWLHLNHSAPQGLGWLGLNWILVGFETALWAWEPLLY